MRAGLEPRGATPRQRRAKRVEGAPTNPPASRDAALDGLSEAHRTDATGDRARLRARRGREASSDAPIEAHVDGTEPVARDDSPEGSPAGPLSASELTASSCSGGSSASEDGDGSAAVDESHGATGDPNEPRRDARSRDANENARNRPRSDPDAPRLALSTASPDDEWPAVGLGAGAKEGSARSAHTAKNADWRCAGDWPCGACAHANSGWRERCARCGAEKNDSLVAAAATAASVSPSCVAGSNLSAYDGVFPPLPEVPVPDDQPRRRGETGAETKRKSAETKRSVFGGGPSATAEAPPEAISLEALERAFAETAAAETAAAETAAAETNTHSDGSEMRVSKETDDDARVVATHATHATHAPFLWRDEADASRDEDAPLPPLPWATKTAEPGKNGDASRESRSKEAEAFTSSLTSDPVDVSNDVSNDDTSHTTTIPEMIEALRKALRLERDARDAAVRAGVAVARERDFDQLKALAENVAEHASARVAADIEARFPETEQRRASLERRLAEAERDAKRHAASSASLAELAERLERRLERVAERCSALEGETNRLAREALGKSFPSAEQGDAAHSTMEDQEDQEEENDGAHSAHSAHSASKQSELLAGGSPHRRDAQRSPPRTNAPAFRLAETRAPGFAKRTRSVESVEDHGIYFEAQPFGGGVTAPVPALEPVGDSGIFGVPRGGPARASDAEEGRKTAPRARADAKKKPARKPRRMKKTQTENAEANASAPDADACDILGIAEVIRAEDAALRERQFRGRARARKTKVSFANALEAKNALPLPKTWARPLPGFFDAAAAREAFVRPS